MRKFPANFACPVAILLSKPIGEVHCHTSQVRSAGKINATATIDTLLL